MLHENREFSNDADSRFFLYFQGFAGFCIFYRNTIFCMGIRYFCNLCNTKCNTEYEFMALGRNPCPVCQNLNGKIFKVKDLQPGENAPPMHPWCHCATAPHWDEATYQAWLESGAAKAGVPYGEFEKRRNTNQSAFGQGLQIRSPASPKSLERSLKSIRAGNAGLSKARKEILSRVPESGDYYRFPKGKISVHDLAYLSAATRDEFSLFRGKNEDLLFHGTTYSCDISAEMTEELINRGYEWIVHSHVDFGNLIESQEDRDTLRKLKQSKSIIIGPTGKEIEFCQSEFS